MDLKLKEAGVSVALNRPTEQVIAPDDPAVDAHLPELIQLGDIPAPKRPDELNECGVDAAVLRDLALKTANTVPHFTTEWASEKLCLPMQLVDDIYWKHKDDKLVEILGENGPFSYRYAITNGGREAATRLMEFCGYIGPAPVSLEAYTALLDWQIAQRPPLTSDDIREAISSLVLTKEAVQVAELAVSSGRSLFLFGPAGNGKTSLGKMLNEAIRGDLWIPHCLNIDGYVIRIFDPQTHDRVHVSSDEAPLGHDPGKTDRRWVRVHRPFVTAGGEMTLAELDLSWSPSLRFYDAPQHIKANGGTFLLDDFGRQRMDPEDLLNRWIVPLETQVDHLTLHTGQKLPVPFRQMLIVSTNLTVSDVADPAFLRRMGYRLHLDAPSPERYAEIFVNYAATCHIEVPPEVTANVLSRYQAEAREFRCSEPRDLIERVRDIARLHHRPLELTQEMIDLAWMGYFGNMEQPQPSGLGHSTEVGHVR